VPPDREPDPAGLVLLEEASGVHRMVLSRPDKRNAISRDMYNQACLQVSVLEKRGVRVAVLAGTGPVFCAGADLGELGSGFNAPVALAERLRRSGTFWVAQVHGGVLGAGIALVSGCHAAFGTADAWFCLPELSHGFYPGPVIDWISGQGISRRWLHGLAVTSRRAAAAEALANGLLSGVAADGSPLAQEVDQFVGRLEAAWPSLRPLLAHSPDRIRKLDAEGNRTDDRDHGEANAARLP
jgi:enoyl-CoA hydratase/carnithine racemase